MTEEEKNKLRKLIEFAKENEITIAEVSNKFGNVIALTESLIKNSTFDALLMQTQFPYRLFRARKKVQSDNREKFYHYIYSINNINTNTINKESIIKESNKPWSEIKENKESLVILVRHIFDTWNSQNATYQKPRKVHKDVLRGYIKLRDNEYSHEQIITAIENYAKWSLLDGTEDREGNLIWFHRWRLHQFLISNKSMERCEDWNQLRKDLKLSFNDVEDDKEAERKAKVRRGFILTIAKDVIEKGESHSWKHIYYPGSQTEEEINAKIEELRKEQSK